MITRFSAPMSTKNPFWNIQAFFKLRRPLRANVCVLHVAHKDAVRGTFFGDPRSYIIEQPEGSPDTLEAISKERKTEIGFDGYPQGKTICRSLQGVQALGDIARSDACGGGTPPIYFGLPRTYHTDFTEAIS
jgi:hypothetical protein